MKKLFFVLAAISIFGTGFAAQERAPKRMTLQTLSNNGSERSAGIADEMEDLQRQHGAVDQVSKERLAKELYSQDRSSHVLKGQEPGLETVFRITAAELNDLKKIHDRYRKRNNLKESLKVAPVYTKSQSASPAGFIWSALRPAGLVDDVINLTIEYSDEVECPNYTIITESRLRALAKLWRFTKENDKPKAAVRQLTENGKLRREGHRKFPELEIKPKEVADFLQKNLTE